MDRMPVCARAAGCCRSRPLTRCSQRAAWRLDAYENEERHLFRMVAEGRTRRAKTRYHSYFGRRTPLFAVPAVIALSVLVWPALPEQVPPRRPLARAGARAACAPRSTGR